MEQAKGDAKATAAGAATITALLDSLENQTGMLGTTAVAAGADYVLTQSKLDAATAEVARLNAHTRQAADAAAKCEKQAVAVAVQSYKSGGAGANLFAAVVMLSSQENLDGADFLMHQVGEQAALKQARAGQARAVAAALEKTRKQAQAAHAELSLAAQHDRDAAVTAQSAVTERIAGQQTQSATLMASLAAPAPRLAAPARQPGAPAGPVIPNPAPAPPGPAAPGPTGGHTSGHTPPRRGGGADPSRRGRQ